jgi:hypothetical protein
MATSDGAPSRVALLLVPRLGVVSSAADRVLVSFRLDANVDEVLQRWRQLHGGDDSAVLNAHACAQDVLFSLRKNTAVLDLFSLRDGEPMTVVCRRNEDGSAPHLAALPQPATAVDGGDDDSDVVLVEAGKRKKQSPRDQKTTEKKRKKDNSAPTTRGLPSMEQRVQAATAQLANLRFAYQRTHDKRYDRALVWCSRMYGQLRARFVDMFATSANFRIPPVDFYRQWPEVSWPRSFLTELYRLYGDPATNVLRLRAGREPLLEELLLCPAPPAAVDEQPPSAMARLVDLLGLLGCCRSPTLVKFLRDVHELELGADRRGPTFFLPSAGNEPADETARLRRMLFSAEELKEAQSPAAAAAAPAEGKNNDEEQNDDDDDAEDQDPAPKRRLVRFSIAFDDE